MAKRIWLSCAGQVCRNCRDGARHAHPGAHPEKDTSERAILRRRPGSATMLRGAGADSVRAVASRRSGSHPAPFGLLPLLALPDPPHDPGEKGADEQGGEGHHGVVSCGTLCAVSLGTGKVVGRRSKYTSAASTISRHPATTRYAFQPLTAPARWPRTKPRYRARSGAPGSRST